MVFFPRPATKCVQAALKKKTWKNQGKSTCSMYQRTKKEQIMQTRLPPAIEPGLPENFIMEKQIHLRKNQISDSMCVYLCVCVCVSLHHTSPCQEKQPPFPSPAMESVLQPCCSFDDARGHTFTLQGTKKKIPPNWKGTVIFPTAFFDIFGWDMLCSREGRYPLLPTFITQDFRKPFKSFLQKNKMRPKLGRKKHPSIPTVSTKLPVA